MENLGNVGCLSPKPLYLKVYDNDLVNSNYIQPLLQEIIQKDLSYQSAKALCYPLKGLIAFNSFSINRICDLKKNYRDIVNRMENDENAFIKLQMRWLEKSIEEVEIVICEADDISWKNHVENLEREIQIILNNKELRQLSSEENKEWKIKIRSDIEYFLKKEGSADDKKLKAVMRTDSPIQSEPFNEAMKIASLPYEMKKLNGSIFAVEKI